MQTSTGRAFSFHQPDVETSHLFTEIAPSLARLPRFNGHTAEFFSVAQHSVLCAQAAEDETGDLELAAYCLLNDAHKAYTGETPYPMVEAIAEALAQGVRQKVVQIVGEARAQQYRSDRHRIRAGIDSVIAHAAGLDNEGWMHHRETVCRIDLRAFWTEREDLMVAGALRWNPPIEATSLLPVRTGRIVPLDEAKAHTLFVDTLQRLCPATAATAANPAGL
jgi:hypothetical protein